MAYKTLQQLRFEHHFHCRRAIELINEARDILAELKAAVPLSEEYASLFEKWLAKHTQAREHVEKTTELGNQFTRELDRWHQRHLN